MANIIDEARIIKLFDLKYAFGDVHHNPAFEVRIATHPTIKRISLETFIMIFILLLSHRSSKSLFPHVGRWVRGFFRVIALASYCSTYQRRKI